MVKALECLWKQRIPACKLNIYILNKISIATHHVSFQCWRKRSSATLHCQTVSIDNLPSRLRDCKCSHFYTQCLACIVFWMMVPTRRGDWKFDFCQTLCTIGIDRILHSTDEIYDFHLYEHVTFAFSWQPVWWNGGHLLFYNILTNKNGIESIFVLLSCRWMMPRRWQFF